MVKKSEQAPSGVCSNFSTASELYEKWHLKQPATSPSPGKSLKVIKNGYIRYRSVYRWSGCNLHPVWLRGKNFA